MKAWYPETKRLVGRVGVARAGWLADARSGGAADARGLLDVYRPAGNFHRRAAAAPLAAGLPALGPDRPAPCSARSTIARDATIYGAAALKFVSGGKWGLGRDADRSFGAEQVAGRRRRA